jgi:hypothetical protein
MRPHDVGFDEFYGNFYHLNAEEEPEQPDYPKNPKFLQKYGPRKVLDCKATDVDDSTVDARWGKVGKQTIKNTGPRDRFFYFSDDGDLLALRFQNWKMHFMVQDQAGTLEIW